MDNCKCIFIFVYICNMNLKLVSRQVKARIYDCRIIYTMKKNYRRNYYVNLEKLFTVKLGEIHVQNLESSNLWEIFLLIKSHLTISTEISKHKTLKKTLKNAFHWISNTKSREFDFLSLKFPQFQQKLWAYRNQ